MLARFADAHRITFPMLSDKDSAVIRRYGILNTNIPRTHMFYGIPFPGEYLVAPDGRVADKVFLPSFRRSRYCIRSFVEKLRYPPPAVIRLR